jgi:glucokinase
MVLGIDLGGTNVKGVVLDDDYNILFQHTISTYNSAHDDWKESIRDLIRQLEKECQTEFKYVGISAPGIPNNANTMIAYMPGRLNGLEFFDWQPYLSKSTYVLNDANAALLAESRVGSLAEKGTRHAIMITLGTGMGGAIMIDRKIYTGMGQKGGHLGHITIDVNDSTPGITGQPGNIEEAIGDCSIFKRTNGRYSSTKDLVKDFESGDQFAKTIWLTSIHKLAIALTGLANVLSPEVIVIGGGMAKAGESLLTPLRDYFLKYEWKPGIEGAEIIFASAGDYAGAMGAAIFAHENQTKWH